MTEQMRIEHICEVFEGWTGLTIRSGYYNTGINFYFLSQHTVGIPAVCFLFLHSIMFEDLYWSNLPLIPKIHSPSMFIFLS